MVEVLRSAKSWHVRPLEMLCVRRSGWTLEDTMLARALDEFEGTRVGWGGFPKRLSEDPMQDGEFDVDDRGRDYAKAAYDEWAAQERKRNGDPEPGRVPRVVWTGWRREQALRGTDPTS